VPEAREIDEQINQPEKETSMKTWVIHVLPSNLSQGTDAIRLLFNALESGVLLVGKSPSHDNLLDDYCSQNKLKKEGQKVFARGWYDQGELLFADGTPGWKRDEVKDFLAGQAVWLSVFNRDMDILRNNIARIPPDPILDFPSVFRPL